MKQIALLFVCACVALGFSACKKEENNSQTPTTPETGTVLVVIKNKVNTQPFVLSETGLSDSLGNNVVPNSLAYYLSSFVLQGAKPFAEANSYHLVRVYSDSSVFEITDVPVGTYSKLDFMFGVDSVANSKTDNVGDLDISNHMSWNWDTGYKFLLVEGSYQEQGQANKGVVYHLGRQETYGNVTTPSFGNEKVVVAKNKVTNITLSANYARIFEGVNVKANSTVMSAGDLNKRVAQNFKNYTFGFIGVVAPR